MKKAVLPEAFLHFIWQTQRFQRQKLTTTAGQYVRVQQPGQINHDAGPDFLHARIQLDDTLWVGQVEIHWRSSEWYAHGHHRDPAYQNVILHVVYEDDRPVLLPNGTAIPTLELEGRISPELVKRYQLLRGQPEWLACRQHFHQVKRIYKAQWADRMGAERLEMQTERVAQWLRKTQGDWDQVAVTLLARALGLRVNASPMEQLMNQLPLPTLLRYRGQRQDLEAFLFGVAGMLSGQFLDDYPRDLQKRFQHLRHKHHLHPLRGQIWKFSRMRPANFPTLRLAQLAALLDSSRRWMADLLDCQDLDDLARYLQFEVSPYWRLHYRFDQPAAAPLPPRLGKATIHLVVINALAPVVFHHGTVRGQPAHCLKAQQWLEQIPPERNAYQRQWDRFGMKADSAFQSQGLLHWRRAYCEKKKCLQCQIGRQLLSREDR